ncbi:MAG: radical SAM protein [Planctomycetes bacterium]|nr:radical SAM protein [Planctomycetota bacterium]
MNSQINRNIIMDENYILAYELGNGEAPLPMRHVSLDLTYRCNNRCNMCFLYGDHLRTHNPIISEIKSRKELTVNEWNFTLIDIWNTGVKEIVLTGGEFFLKKDSVSILRHAKELGFSITVLSNGGLITSDKARKVVQIEPNLIRFSLDGDRETHDKICGVTNYDHLMRSINLLTEEKKAQNKQKPQLAFETVIQKINQDKLHHIVEAAAAKNMSYVVMSNIFFVPCESSASCNTHDEFQKTRGISQSLYNVDVDILHSELEKTRELAAKLGVKFICRMETKKDIENIYYNSNFSYINKCLYPWLMCRINPYGDVIPCTGSSLRMGNVLEQSISEIWNSESYCRFRRKLRDEELFPECLKCNTLSFKGWESWEKAKPKVSSVG